MEPGLTPARQSRNPSEDKDRRSLTTEGTEGTEEKQKCLSLRPLCPLWFSPSPAFFPFVRVAICSVSTEKLNLSTTEGTEGTEEKSKCLPLCLLCPQWLALLHSWPLIWFNRQR